MSDELGRHDLLAWLQRARQLLSIAHHPVVIAIALLTACSRPTPMDHQTEFLAMGTTVSVEVIGVDADVAHEAIEMVRSEFQYLGREWYPWENNGELVRLNKAFTVGQKVTVSPALARLLTRAREWHRVSDGAFDPAVGALVEMWGFHRGERDASHSWPDESQLDAWRKDRPTFADIVIEDRIVSSRRKDLKLDLGAVGKGHSVDVGIEILKQRGVKNALINAGGNLRAIGFASSAARPWRVAIRHPRDSGAMAWLELQGDESLSTSGDYERFAMRDEQRFNHILDPRTGRSATHTIAVTVIAQDATLADAASTAIFVAGKPSWREIARKMGIRQVLRMDADGSVEVSRELSVRLRSPGSEARQVEWQAIDL